MEVTIKIPQEFISTVKQDKLFQELPYEDRGNAMRELFKLFVECSTGPADWLHEAILQWMDNNEDEISDTLYEVTLK